ncbi:MAG: family 10 glycosylhydrolase [Gimesia chilikensis]|uniref:family 10 glycosylhydrolase n=1 Tax=Gimesia chilikensis TaxID=2605989 RepID=UPI0037974994
MNRFVTCFLHGMLLPLMALIVQDACQAEAPADAVSMKAQRKKAAWKKRRIIFNNDGNEPVYYLKEATPKALLDVRTSPLADSQVDAIFYCTWSSGFSYFTHDTKVGSLFTETGNKLSNNKTAELIERGHDPLQVMADWCNQQDVELFWSFRMNDTHDASTAWYGPLLFPPLKKEHPEWLVGSAEKKPRNGRWTAVDFTRPEICDLAFQYVQEVCQNYDVDGIELDFFRHLNYFKRVSWGLPAGEEELNRMTDLLRRIREMADREGQKRGKPILIAIRVPDSVEYSRVLGLDVETWLKEDLVDIMTVSGYFRLNPWSKSVQLGHHHEVPVYAGLSESRQKDQTARKVYASTEGFRGRALNAWNQGVDGIYLFNSFNPNHPLWRELGNPNQLRKLPKVYFTSARSYSSVNHWWKAGSSYMNREILTPDHPRKIMPDQQVGVTLMVGEDPIITGAKLRLRVRLKQALSEPETLQVLVNGTPVAIAPDARFLEGAVQQKLVKSGENRIEFQLSGKAEQPAVVEDLQLWVKY